MSETSKRRLLAGKQARPKKGGDSVQKVAPPEPTSSERDHMPLGDRLKSLNGQGHQDAGPGAVEASSQRVAGKRQAVDVDEAPVPKRARQADLPRAVFAAEDEDVVPLDPVTIAVPPKTVQFANHMIIGSQMELAEIEELPKKLLREEAGRAFRLQASASMDMWLCMKRAINAAERAKRAYDAGQSKVAEAAKVLQDNANLVKDKEAAERQLKATEEKLAHIRSNLDAAVKAASDAEAAKQALHVTLEQNERSKAAEVKDAVNRAIETYRSSEDFTVLLDKEVGSEMVDLVYRFKRFNPGQKLNLNFASDPPPLPEGITEQMIEEYEGEDADPEATDA